MLRLFFALLLLLSFSGCWDSADNAPSNETNQTETTLHDDSSMPKPIIEEEPTVEEEPEPLVEEENLTAEENLSIANAPLEVVAVQSVGTTQQESVKATVQATPFSDVYVNGVKITVTDEQGHALITLNTSGTVGNKRFNIHVENKSGQQSKKYALVIRKEEAGSAKPLPKLVSLTLSKSALQLIEGETAKLSVLGRYDNGRTQDFTQNVTWYIGDNSIVSVSGNTLTALANGSTMLYASYSSVRSNTLNITVDDVVSGYRLPPEPDPAVNNATLLGVDSNNNGVRDDVERWIYTTYNTYIPCERKPVTVPLPDGSTIQAYEKVCAEEPVKYHQIVREIAMQGARAAQIIIQEPEKAREMVKHVHNAIDCNVYFNLHGKEVSVSIDHGIFVSPEFKAIQFNTIQRARAFAKYNFALSGGVYSANGSEEEMRDTCDFNVNALLKE